MMTGPVIALVFGWMPYTNVRAIVGAVVQDDADGRWYYIEVEPIPVPREVVPTSALAALDKRLKAAMN